MCVSNWAIDRLTRMIDVPQRPSSLTIWALLLPEAGFRSQVLGLADALTGSVVEKNITVRLPWSHLPLALCPFPLMGLGSGSDPLTPPWPDLVISCGRRTIPIAIAIKRASGGRTKAVHIQDCKSAASAFDLVIPMSHDGLSGHNVLPVDTALHRVSTTRLAEAHDAWHERMRSYTRPLIGVILGGRNRTYRFTRDVADRLISLLETLQHQTGATFYITPSRRTEAEAAECFKAFAERSRSIIYWSGDGDNPYLGILAHADALIVTEDSVSMVSEALATGKPVATFPLEGVSKRHGEFIERLRAKGAITRFDGTFPIAARTIVPNATLLAAEAVNALFA